MHIAEGVLSPVVLGSGAVLAGVGTAIGLRKTDVDRVPAVAVLSSAFFVASLIHVPIPPTSVHLILNGLLGIILGWAAFPAILVALTLQSVFFGFGGLTTLGVNTVNMALPAVVCHYLFRRMMRNHELTRAFPAGFLAGSLAIALAGLLNCTCLLTTGEAFRHLAKVVLAAHIPVMLIEGAVTGFVVSFLARVRPEVLCEVRAASNEEKSFA